MDIKELAAKAEKKCEEAFKRIDRIAEYNTQKVMEAFSAEKVSDSFFSGTTGYGYDDRGREALDRVYARVFEGEKALVRTSFVNGSHAIACGMMACLKSGDTLLSVTGDPYDTLQTLIGLRGEVGGTLSEYGIKYDRVPLKDGAPDLEAIKKEASRASAIFIQRSRGYAVRKTLSYDDIKEICDSVKSVNKTAPVILDNCYGEFCETRSPLSAGVDLICGSLIKNPGGGIAPGGGYIVGKEKLLDRAANRLTLPGIGGECGATYGLNRLLFQGLFLAPHTVAQALKTAAFAAAALKELGYEVSPLHDEPRYDIIQTVSFKSPAPLLAFCRGVQEGAPVDSFVTPEPWDMPGYDCPVVMAAGAFIQGASIELSCDAPMREPYTAYLQGGLTYESGKYGLLKALSRLAEM